MKRSAALLGAALAVLAATPAAFAANAADCPNGGVVRFGVEPYDTSAKLVPIYQHIGDAIAAKLGCQVKVYVTTNYNAEIEAMRNGKLEIGEFGPLGYVLAYQVARHERSRRSAPRKASRTATGPASSPIPGPASRRWRTSRVTPSPSLIPPRPPATCSRPMACARRGWIRTRTCAASMPAAIPPRFEALYNHKVDAGELNSEQLESATQRGEYKDGVFVFLWKSDPIPTDPITVRGDLPEGFKQRLTVVLQNLDLSSLPEADRKIMGLSGMRFVPQTDGAYDGIRDLVKTLNIDLDKLS